MHLNKPDTPMALKGHDSRNPVATPFKREKGAGNDFLSPLVRSSATVFAQRKIVVGLLAEIHAFID